MTDSQPSILFLSLSDDAGAERIVSEMARRGARCSVMARRNSVVARPAGVARHIVLPGWAGPLTAALGLGRRLAAAARACAAEAVVPLDDLSAALLRDIALARRTAPGLRTLIARSLGDPAHYRTAGCRDLFIAEAARLGLRTPAQGRATDGAAARGVAALLGYPLMLKREATCGGAGVVLVRDAAALAAAFAAADRRARAKRAGRRLLGFGAAPQSASITLQAHVAGQLALRTVACRDGRVLAGVTFLAERLNPPVTGSSTVVRPLAHPEIEVAAARLVAALGCSGFVSFDFIVAADGGAHLIEMNARPVGSGHLGLRVGADLYGAFLSGFPGFRDAAPPAAPRPEAVRAVALFPKEMMRDPDSPDIGAGAGIDHDVPWHEPAVVAHYGALLAARHPAAAEAIGRRLGLPRAAAPPAARLRGLGPLRLRLKRSAAPSP